MIAPHYMMALSFAVSGIYAAFMIISAKRAAQGKGWMAAYGRRLFLRQWGHVLHPHELLVQASTGTLDDGADIDDVYNTQYMMVLTNFGRLLITPYSVFAFSSVVRRFQSYDRSTVSFIEIIMEASIPQQVISFHQAPKMFTATLALPNARIRLKHVSAGIIEELRR